MTKALLECTAMDCTNKLKSKEDKAQGLCEDHRIAVLPPELPETLL